MDTKNKTENNRNNKNAVAASPPPSRCNNNKKDNAKRQRQGGGETYSCKCMVRYGSYFFRGLFGTNDETIKLNEKVVIKSPRDTEIGTVISPPVPAASKEKLKGPVLRRATDRDIEKMDELEKKAHHDHWEFVEEKALELGLKMRIVNVERLFGEQKVVVHYTADGRVDFRELVHMLARRFRARIEMRQIGPRDCTRIYGGIGTCGLSLCCATWLNRIEPVTIRMAKEQGQPLNPSKNCGICGKLKCCLRYELDNGDLRTMKNNN